MLRAVGVVGVTPDISIVIPTYNRADYLGQAIESALAQDFAGVEVLVVDDGSTDGTREVVAGFDDARLRYVHQDNQGATSAFNAGLRGTSARYVSVLGSDDWYVAGGLAPLFRRLEAEPGLGAVGGGYAYVDGDGRALGREEPWREYPVLDVRTWLMACPILLQAGLFRRAWVDRVGGFDPGIRIVQDWDFGLRLAAAGCPMAWERTTVFHYRQHPGNSIKAIERVREDSLQVLRNFVARHELRGAPYGVLAGRLHLNAARMYFSMGDVEAGHGAVAAAVDCDPGLLDGDGIRLARLLVAWERNDSVVPMGADFVGGVAANLPLPADRMAGFRKRLRVEADLTELYQAYRAGRYDQVLSAGRRLARVAPSAVLSRGVLSMLSRSVVGWVRAGWVGGGPHPPAPSPKTAGGGGDRLAGS